MASLLDELRHAGRVVSRDRTFSATAVLTLALCIGANAAIFTIVNAVLLRPLPFEHAAQLVWVANSYPRAGVAEGDNSVPDYEDRRTHVAAFADVAVYRTVGRTVGTAGGTERVTGVEATPSLFRLLGVRPVRGRLFTEDDGEPGRARTAVLSYAFWQEQFGGSDHAIGRDVRLNGVPHAIVGVLPQDFAFGDPAARVWIPTAFTPDDRSDASRHNNNYLMVARLRPGATVEQAQRQVDALNAVQIERSPVRQALLDAGFATSVTPLEERLVREVRRTLYLLWGGAVFVLLIGVVNVTSLTLVRAASRAREFATRQALGAGVWPLARQLLAESLVLTSAAGALGFALGSVVVRSVVAGVADRIPRGDEIGVDAGTAAFTAGVAIAAGAVVALLPLLNARRVSLAQTVREEGRSGTPSRISRLVRRGLVTAQVAFAFMLLIGAGLLLASFRAVLSVDPGFDPAGVLTGRVSLPASSYATDERVVATMAALRERVMAIPGVAAAGLASAAPFTGSYSDSVIFAEGYVAPRGESVISPARNVVTPGYFEAMKIPLTRGRLIDRRDTADSALVVVIDERLARKFWAGQDPIGRRMWQPQSAEEVGRGPGPDTRWLTVVGVVGEVKQRGLTGEEERIGAYYFPHAQNAALTMTLLIRTSLDPTSIVPAVRRELTAVDAELPLYGVLTMEERVGASVAGRRTAMLLAVGFGALALLLATVGIYGVLAYQVTQRTREIGIRMALGSGAGAVFGLILREGVVVLAAGSAIGLAGAFAMRQALAGELFGVDAMEPAVLGGVAALLAAVALTACALPARRASRIDPAIALTE